MQKLIAILFFCLGLLTELRSQQVLVDTMPQPAGTNGMIIRGSCKLTMVGYPGFQAIESPVEIIPNKRVAPVDPLPVTIGHPLLRVSGNILYDVNYRSRIDTPYAENDIYQHMLQTRLDFVYKDQYSFRIYLTTHFSNSSLFRNYTDLNFHYIQSDFSRLMKNRILAAAEPYLFSRTRELDSLKRLIDLKKTLISSLSQAIQKPNLSQKLVEERERNLFGAGTGKPIPTAALNSAETQEQLSWPGKYKFYGASQGKGNAGTGDAKKDSLSHAYSAYKDSLESRKKRLDSLANELERLEALYAKIRSLRQVNSNEWKKEVEEAKDGNALTQKLEQVNMPDTLLPKGYKTLMAIQSFSIGRSMANYSELSVKNISITGVQVEYNPRYYYAFAAGKVDYRFRDYIVPDQPRSSQYVALVRFGKGARNGNHIFFTYYTGRRQFFNSSVASQPNNPVPEYNLAGFTIEGYYKITRNISLVAEVAKSTVPYYSLDSLQRKGWMNSVTSFKDRSNEAYSVRVNADLPKTQTRITGSMRYIGANFQSFSTFTTGASQTKWLARIEQPFFKKKLDIISSVQQNDYNNPFVATSYKSSSVLASIQASLRIKKWPFLSLGYYPSYQLIKISDNSYSESRYYTLVGSTGYYYQLHSVQLSTYLIYSQFYNQATDSGFVYFNSRNLLISQNATMGRVSVLLNASVSANTGYSIYTLENNDQFAISRIITAGAGVKMIRYTLVKNLQWGYSANLTLKIPKLGDIQLMMDKGFIPGLARQLVENNLGRLTYFKTF